MDTVYSYGLMLRIKINVEGQNSMLVFNVRFCG
jgi:hypothetical protein